MLVVGPSRSEHQGIPRFMKARPPTTKPPVRSAGVHARRRKALVRRPKHRACAREALVRARKCTPPFMEALAPSRSLGPSSGKRVAPSRKASPRARKHSRSSRKARFRKTNRYCRAARLPTEKGRGGPRIEDGETCSPSRALLGGQGAPVRPPGRSSLRRVPTPACRASTGLASRGRDPSRWASPAPPSVADQRSERGCSEAL